MLVHPDAMFRSALDRHRDALRETRGAATPFAAFVRGLGGARHRHDGPRPHADE